MSGEVISLNVGGTIFVTSVATLTKDPDSMLASMFGATTELPPARKDGQGNYFIDRDPEAFRVILSFLRSASLSEDVAGLEQLEVEADYFRLCGLLKIIRQRRSVEPMSRRAPDPEDDDGVRDLILVKCYGGEMGRAVAMRVNTKSSSPKYEFEGDTGVGLHASVINSMGSSLPEVKRDPYYYKSTVTARELGGVRTKRSVWFICTMNRPSLKDMMEVEERILRAWEFYWSGASQDDRAIKIWH